MPHLAITRRTAVHLQSAVDRLASARPGGQQDGNVLVVVDGEAALAALKLIFWVFLGEGRAIGQPAQLPALYEPESDEPKYSDRLKPENPCIVHHYS